MIWISNLCLERIKAILKIISPEDVTIATLLDENIDTRLCTGCGLCAASCPVLAIEMITAGYRERDGGL
ncbi:MAG: 4Fe-4S binding protein [Bacillota bacterium]